MRNFSFVFSFWTMVFYLGCETTVSIEADHNEVLALDAVFYSGEPLSDIHLQKSFNVTGSSVRTIPLSEVEISEAEIVLHKNDTLISVRYVGNGYYRPDSSYEVRQGDVIKISVHTPQFDVSSQAVVPTVDTERVRFEVENVSSVRKIGARTRADRQKIDTLWAFDLQTRFEQPFIPPFTAMQWFSESEALFEDEYRIPFELSDFQSYADFKTFFGDQYQNIPSIIWRKQIRLFYPLDEKPSGEQMINFYTSLVYPEEIYVNASRLTSDAFVPVTVTNVDGGVGLFIGAVREEKEIELLVDFGDSD